ncbi:MAG: sugar phosphate isomerase/epimerase [Clostridia bacterium]|nr:sugar phosphate isomerase/epimerase [Clostridia bacterium]
MKFGTCANWKKRDELLAAKAAGAEFVEFNFSSLIDATQEEVNDLAAFLKEIDLPCLSYNGMLPGSCRVTGEDRDYEKAAKFLDDVMTKVAVLDARNVVFGSCGARCLRDGEDWETAMCQMSEFIKGYLIPVFEKHGFICAIETLSECNLVHTMEHGLRLVNEANHPRVQLLCDFYHVWKNGEPMDRYDIYGPHLRHVHVASVSLGRAIPRHGDGDEEKYIEMFRILNREGYDGPVSLEGSRKTDDYTAETKEALDYLRECYAKA